MLSLPPNSEALGVGEKAASPWEANGTQVLKGKPGFWWERRWEKCSVKTAKELLNQRTRFLKSQWKDWDGRRLDADETWKVLEKMGSQKTCAQGSYLLFRNVEHSGCNQLKVANRMSAVTTSLVDSGHPGIPGVICRLQILYSKKGSGSVG